MQLFSFSSYAERKNAPELVACWQQTTLLAQVLQGQAGSVYCPICRHVSSLKLPPGVLDPREHMCCDVCGLNSRVRAGMALIYDLAPSAECIYMTEQATPAFVAMQKRHPDVMGSEFQPDAKARRQLSRHLGALGGRGEVQYQDATALSFADASLDAVLSFDVLEHVPDYRQALAEFARTLVQGGVCVATFPFTDTLETRTRAKVTAQGDIVHLLEPEYHGDPISGGVLCFYHFGWDVLDAATEAGFNSARMVMPWAPQSGFYYGLWTLVATR